MIKLLKMQPKDTILRGLLIILINKDDASIKTQVVW